MSSKYKFFPRVLKLQHLEFDSAFQQILWTITDPKRVFRHHKDRNAMRGYWARDDPAVLLIVLAFLAVSTVVYCLWMRFPVLKFFVAWLWVIVGDGLVLGAIIATVMWVVSNTVFIRQTTQTKAVEWAYCFDVHLNAFIPLAIFVYGIQAIFWPLMSSTNIVSVLVTNTLWLMILTCYMYVTFLGYTILPSSSNTMVLLAACLPLGIIYIFFVPFKLNAADIFSRVFAGRCGVHYIPYL